MYKMEPVYFEVTAKKLDKGIDFRVGTHPQYKQAYARFEKARGRLSSARKRGEDLGALAEEFGNAADCIVLARQAVTKERIELYVQAYNSREGVNLDHMQLQVFNLGVLGTNFGNGKVDNVAGAEKRFLEYTGPGAAVAYAIPWTADKIFIAVGGAVNTKRIKKLLERRGYVVNKIEGIPEVSKCPRIERSSLTEPQKPVVREVYEEKPVQKKTTLETVRRRISERKAREAAGKAKYKNKRG
jgi:hypothetical protein